VNLYGEVVGINTAIASNSGGNEGIGFSIPVNLIKTVIGRILEDGKVERGFLGVLLLEASEFSAERATEVGLGRNRGAFVVRVSPNTPASRADLRPGDVVLEFNGTEIEDQAHLINLVSLARIGEKATLVIWRNQRRMTLEVVLGDREALQQQVSASALPDDRFDQLDRIQQMTGRNARIESLGVTVVGLTPEVRTQLGLPQEMSGLLVVGVDPKGPVGFRILPFDVIDQVEREPIRSVEDLEKALRDLRVPEGMAVRIRRRIGEEEIVQRLIVKPRAE
jgi:serine protease Do